MRRRPTHPPPCPSRALALLLTLLSAHPLLAQDATYRPWWLEVGFGYGRFHRTSDQAPGSSTASFAEAFRAGYALGPRVRIGVSVNGWLLQAYNLTNPTLGESGTTVLALAQVFPFTRPLFLEAGAGYASNDSNHPGAWTTRGWGWAAGTGYRLPVTRGFSLTPALYYSSARLGDTPASSPPETAIGFSVWDVRLSATLHLGTDRRAEPPLAPATPAR
jgi:hypothetical protein